MKFEKLLGLQIFKTNNCNPIRHVFQVWSIRVHPFAFAVLFIPSFNVLSGYFHLSLKLVEATTV